MTDAKRQQRRPDATAPLAWMQALRDDPAVTGNRLLVLWCVATRLRRDGTGYAAQGQVAADTGLDVRTVRRHLKAAAAAGYLDRTRRGHRVGDGRTFASEWALTLPQPVTGVRLTDDSQPDTGDRLTRESQPDNRGSQPDNRAPQPDTGDRPRENYQRELPEFRLSETGISLARDSDDPAAELDALHASGATPFDVGRRGGQLKAAGAVRPGHTFDFIRDRFDAPGEEPGTSTDARAAWAGHTRGTADGDPFADFDALAAAVTGRTPPDGDPPSQPDYRDPLDCDRCEQAALRQLARHADALADRDDADDHTDRLIARYRRKAAADHANHAGEATG